MTENEMHYTDRDLDALADRCITASTGIGGGQELSGTRLTRLEWEALGVALRDGASALRENAALRAQLAGALNSAAPSSRIANCCEAREQTSALKAAMTEHVQPLSVQIESGVLVIRVGIKTLAHAVVWSEWAHSWDDETGDYIRRFAIEDHHQFAKDVMSMMRREEEDGSSLLSNFIDKAGEKAVDDGSLGLADGDHQIKYGEKSPLEKW